MSTCAHSSLLAPTRASKSPPLAPTHSILLLAPTALTGQRFSQLPRIGVTFVPSQSPQYLPESYSRTVKTEPVRYSKTPKKSTT